MLASMLSRLDVLRIMILNRFVPLVAFRIIACSLNVIYRRVSSSMDYLVILVASYHPMQ